MAVVNRRRPLSRGSTASVRSATTQPNMDHSFADTSDMYQQHWLPNDHHGRHNQHGHHGHHNHHSQARDLTPAPPHMTPEDLLLASQLQANREYNAMEASVNTSMHSASFPAAHHMSRQSLSADSFTANIGFADDSQMTERDGNDDNESFTGGPGNTRAISRSSANNEMEMRQLFSGNKHRSLQDVAEELHGNERGPNSERTRQVFAMLWINTVCAKGKGSVPRGRVYANYASRCATERITVLNPASFGKLVRVLFPGLKTRRLGVRGESKYHYVNFTLLEDPTDMRDGLTQPRLPLLDSNTSNMNFNVIPNNPPVARPDRTYPMLDVSPAEPQISRPHEFSHSLYNQPQVSSIDQLQATKGKTAQKFYFEGDKTEPFLQSDPLILPRIADFLPNGTDPDAAKSLMALYRSHCTSLVECIRYCREKTFFHLFTSFQGTLTMPVQKLFGHPDMAAWIEECDFTLYQRMMRIISGLVLQVVPKPVLDTLRGISERLVPHIRESFQGQPLHVMRAKEGPATIFAGLLDRALRVNLTAHAAANMLANPANRDLMYTEWITMINVRKTAECVPSRAMDDVVSLLLGEMRDLLDPVDVPWEIEGMTAYADAALRSGRQARGAGPGDSSASNALDRWVSFFRSLPGRFPYASHTDIVWCVERLGTCVMRDLTIQQGKSFGSWWVTKCWIDEMVQFLAEQGGFMKTKTIRRSVSVSKRPMASRELSNVESRYSSASDDFNMSHMSQTQPDRAPFPSGPPSNPQSNHDDSGIGIRTPDEDLPGEKYGFIPANGQDIFGSAGLQGRLTNV